MAVTGKTTKTKKSTVFSRMAPATKFLYFVALIVLLASVFAWWQFVRNTAENTFESMLDNSFRTASVTRRVTQDSGSQSLDQIVRLQNQTQHVAHGKTILTQKVGEESTVIVTESIGTPTSDYIRYAEITTDQKTPKGDKINFGKVLNVWGKSEVTAEDSIGELYQDNALGLFLFGDFSSDQRQNLLNLIKDNNVYSTNYGSAKKFTKNGRNYYAYRVSIKPSSYVKLLKLYGEYVGINQLASLNPDSYENAQELTFNVTVDILSQRLDTISAVSGERQESFSGYGIIQPIEIPTDTISLPDLQKRLNETTSI